MKRKWKVKNMLLENPPVNDTTFPDGTRFKATDFEASFLERVQQAALSGALDGNADLQFQVTVALKDWQRRHPEFDSYAKEYDFYTGIAGGGPAFIVELKGKRP
jgi:hypothetical protein